MPYENMKLHLGNTAKENLFQILIVVLKQVSYRSKLSSKSSVTLINVILLRWEDFTSR